MVSEQVTKAYKILRVMAIISGSLVLRAAKFELEWILNITLDGDNQLWDHRQNLGSSFFKHIKDTLHSQESVRVLLFSNTLKENRQIMMVIQLLDFDFPVDFVLRSMLNGNGEISSVIEPSELTRGNLSLIESSSLWLLWERFLFRLVQTCSLSS